MACDPYSRLRIFGIDAGVENCRLLKKKTKTGNGEIVASNGGYMAVRKKKRKVVKKKTAKKRVLKRKTAKKTVKRKASKKTVKRKKRKTVSAAKLKHSGTCGETCGVCGP